MGDNETPAEDPAPLAAAFQVEIRAEGRRVDPPTQREDDNGS